jgi:Mrp family chromosome partitioning ATPase
MGAARSQAVAALLARAKASFEVVLINSPALLEVADATELVGASDAAIIVLSPRDLIRDQVEMANRLKLIGTDVAGYVYNRAPMPAHLARYRRNNPPTGSMGPPVAAPATATTTAPLPALTASERPVNGERRASLQPRPLR